MSETLTTPTLATAVDIETRMRQILTEWLQRTRPTWINRHYLSQSRFRTLMRQSTGLMVEELAALEQAGVMWCDRHAERKQADADRIEAHLHGVASIVRTAMLEGENPTAVQSRTAFVHLPPMVTKRGATKPHSVFLPHGG